ncbi:MAG TPA: serine/threonine-protein kinase [Elusimicrobiota bacterium]|nr:serine/threonine-protein kinase [Elusimicrobiota bacterium]
MIAFGRSVLLCLLAAAAFAQPAPPPGTPPPDLGLFFYEVRSHPTDAKTVNPRFRVFMQALEARGVPPDPDLQKKLTDIRALLGKGSLTKAASLLDQAVNQAVVGDQIMGAGKSPASAGAAPAAEASEEPEVGSMAPALLSAPAQEKTLAPAAAPAVSAIVAAGAPVASAQPALPAASVETRAEPRGPPPRLLLFVLGAILISAATLVYALARLSQTPKPAKKELGKTIAPPAPASPAVASAGSGTLTDKYSVGRLIASGGMGEVYEGRDLKLGRRVAIKRMLSEVKLDSGLRSAFLNEAKTVAKLSHPYIIPIHDCLESGGDLYLVFEFVDGETLDRRLVRDARLPLKECRRILRYVCAAVDHAHKNHVLHRDLKPANIMVDKDGIARVMDFGIALESTRTMTTAAPGFLDSSGTLRYMPPEQHYGKSVRASDIYALGVTLYEMATGHPPFAAGTAEELLEAKHERRYPPPSALRPELPKEFDLFIAAALAPDARNRVSSAQEFLEALDAIPL